jgi:hypothetical protein
VIFHSDFGSGIKLTPGQAARQKHLQSGRGWPDMLIAEPRGRFHGLFVEIKAEGARTHRSDGTPASEHVAEQEALLKALSDRGYMAVMAHGFEACRAVVDNYLSLEEQSV